MALLNARVALNGLAQKDNDEGIACKILARALEEPMRAIAKNAGYLPDIVIEKVQSLSKGMGFDARSGKMVDLRAHGIVDSVPVLEKALEIAVGGAAMALTTDVIVHHSRPVETIEP